MDRETSESGGKSEKMVNEQKRGRRNVLALTGAAALVALAVNLAISGFNSLKKQTEKKGFLYFLSNSPGSAHTHTPTLFSVIGDYF